MQELTLRVGNKRLENARMSGVKNAGIRNVTEHETKYGKQNSQWQR